MCFLFYASAFDDVVEFEEWRAIRASVGGVSGVQAWVAYFLG